MKVPSGTPKRLATVMPTTMIETALARCPFVGHTLSATNRPHTEKGAVGKSRDKTHGQQHPVVGSKGRTEIAQDDQSRQDQKNLLQRAFFRATSTMSGAPEADTQRIGRDQMAGLGIETPRLRAMSGRIPIITNSDMPSASVPKASAIRLFSSILTILPAAKVTKKRGKGSLLPPFSNFSEIHCPGNRTVRQPAAERLRTASHRLPTPEEQSPTDQS